MEKYIIELSSSGGDDFYESEMYSVETDKTVSEMYKMICDKSNVIQTAYRKMQDKKPVKSNVVYFKPAYEAKELTDINGNWKNKFVDMCIIQFEVGSVIVPVNLEKEEVLILTLDDWFKYCMRD
jgi:hypothetical protein